MTRDLLTTTRRFWTRKLGRDVSVDEAEEILQQARLFVRLLTEYAFVDERRISAQSPSDDRRAFRGQ
jgi:hypothetical protein